MKHITTYQLYESSSNDEIISTLKDIALDIEDDGYSVYAGLTGSTFNNELNTNPYLAVYIDKIRSYKTEEGYDRISFIPFDSFDIINYINRIISYMDSEGFETKIFSYMGGSLQSLTPILVTKSSISNPYGNFKSFSNGKICDRIMLKFNK